MLGRTEGPGRRAQAWRVVICTVNERCRRRLGDHTGVGSPDVIVVGAGVIGASVAYHLARDGAAVTLVDPGSPRSPSASWASAGGVRSQDRDAAEWPLTVAAAARWPILEEELGADCEFRRGGHLHVAVDADLVGRLAARVAAERRAGVAVELIDGDTARELAPGLTTDAVAATWTAGDGQANPRLTTAAFIAAARRNGAALLSDTVVALTTDGDAVTGVRTASRLLSAGVVVVAAGSWSPALLDAAGTRLPIRAVSLQMLRTVAMRARLGPTVGAEQLPISIKQVPDGSHLIGGGWPGDIDVRAHTASVREDSVAGNRGAAARLLPHLADAALADRWCGLECTSDDSLPFIGDAPQRRGLYVAVGFSGHGFQIAPAVGEAVAADLLHGPARALAQLRPARATTTVAGGAAAPNAARAG
jgi:sarcosine oxidase subunit beta